MLTLLIITFLFAFSILFFGRYLHPKWMKFISVVPLMLLMYFARYIPSVGAKKNTLLFANEWIPSLGINLDLKIDGLSLFFSLLITGIGFLVYIYASSYLYNDKYIHRFYGFLTIFMGAMLGVVLSDNLISLFIFWELTSISSFFLIGYKTESKTSRNNALWALSITGLGGFFMLASFAIIEYCIGSYSLHEILTQRQLVVEHRYYYLIIFFLFAGAFTKSAQFPFHFWLPGAMKAPTPVSAYLHSATMVKAGIYLLARFSPILSDGFIWNTTLLITGGITMVIGAFFSIFKTDLKEILAYTTISVLGVLVFLLGIGNETAMYATITFIFAHALYKATLFMVVGIVDHKTHTRDLTVLSGLKTKMPIVAICAAIAALSSAGIPFTFGFIAKELIYGATFDFDYWQTSWGWILTGLAFITNVFISTSGFMVGFKPFFGILPENFKTIVSPNIKLWIPLVVLCALSIFFGIFPHVVDIGLLSSTTQTIVTDRLNQELHLWHGWNFILAWSGATILLAFVLYKFITPSTKRENTIAHWSRYNPKYVITEMAHWIKTFAFNYTRFFHNGYLRYYIMYILVFFIGLIGWRLFRDVSLRINLKDLSPLRIYEVTIFLLIIAAIFLITTTKSRLTAIAALGIVGYSICLIFVVYGAPDLAMTQFAIDTLTVVLFVLVLFKLPSFLRLSNSKNKLRDLVLSTLFGILIAIITLQATLYPSNKEVSKFYAENAYVLAKGKNIVNVILVDYRGFDTLIETIVLSIAALGVWSILKYKTEDGEKTE